MYQNILVDPLLDKQGHNKFIFLTYGTRTHIKKPIIEKTNIFPKKEGSETISPLVIRP